MCRVLVLDDEPYSAQTVKLVIETKSDNMADIVTTAVDAIDLVTRSIQDGKPYEAFLIDQQLGDGENGIEVMKALRNISPDTETIIFTGYGDSADGLNAYRAGAFRYLPKPFDNQELLYLIDVLREWRRTRQEHGWQKIFSEMMETALQQDNFQDTANVVVSYSLKLGFERAHLFWIPTGEDVNKENRLIGIACAGEHNIQNFKGRLYPLLEWFNLAQLTDNNNAIFIHDFHREETINSAVSYGYHLPSLEVALLPIGRVDTLAGFLLLDYNELKRTIGEQERFLLNLFARQVSVVLNRASAHGRGQWLLQESSIIQTIGRQITTRAASANLIDLLQEIRRQIGALMDVSNFSVFLKNEENNELDFHLLYEHGKRRKEIRKPMDHGFEEYLLAYQKEILLSHTELIAFIREHQIDFKGTIPSSLLAVPLRVENKTIGGVIVSQYSAWGSEYFERDKRILLSVADQVAGAIQISRLSEAEKEDARRMQVMQQASVEMLRIAQENEDHFWLTVLTIATSGFGLGFNRALLFLEEENFRRLRGRMGVGTEGVEEAAEDWERDEKRKYDFQSFLMDLGTKRMRHTPFETITKNVCFELNGKTIINQVIREKTRQTVQPHEIPWQLPVEITRTFSLATCAILPLRAGDKILGIVIVDNKHNGEALKERLLDRLQTLLDNAGLVWETWQERRKSASLLKANYEILSGARDQPLRETLNHICRTARIFSGADWAILLPILENDQHQFDTDNIGFDGELQKNAIGGIIDSTHLGGISQHVLRKGTLVINDIDAGTSVNRQLKILDHHFIKSEGVKALIGAAVRSKDDEKPLGLLYLDYRQPRKFSSLEMQQALSFATLAGVAISNARRMDELHQRRQLKTAKEIAETIGTGLDLEKTMEAIMRILHHTVFEKTRLCLLLYQNDTRLLKFAPATLKYYRIQNPDYRKQDTFPLSGKSIACRVAKEALRTRKVAFANVGNVADDPDYLSLNSKIESELCVSLMSTKNDLLGVLVLERDKRDGFAGADEDLVKTVAQQLSIAIERAQQSEELAFRSTVAAQTAWAADIAHEINNEVGQIRSWAYMLREQLDPNSSLYEYAKKIEVSASVLSSTGPWSDQPPQVIKLDPFLERHVGKLAQPRDLDVEFQLKASEVYIRVNPVELQHVLRHLVRNAARAMSSSKVKKLTVHTQLLNESLVEILLQDSGPGISKNVRLSIFQRPITTKGRGGYGLLLVRQMIEDMDGHIRLGQQTIGQGAVFSIQFPVASLMDGTVV